MSTKAEAARVLLSHESLEEFENLKADIAKHFKAVDDLEAELVHETAASRWHLLRIEERDAALFQKFMRQQEETLGAEADPSQSGTPHTSMSSPNVSSTACSRAIRVNSDASTRKSGRR
jgi:hypothetical protein